MKQEPSSLAPQQAEPPEPPPRAAIWGHCTSGTPLPMHPRVPAAPGLILPGPIPGGGQLLGQIFWDEAPFSPSHCAAATRGAAPREPTGGRWPLPPPRGGPGTVPPVPVPAPALKRTRGKKKNTATTPLCCPALRPPMPNGWSDEDAPRINKKKRHKEVV